MNDGFILLLTGSMMIGLLLFMWIISFASKKIKRIAWVFFILAAVIYLIITIIDIHTTNERIALAKKIENERIALAEKIENEQKALVSIEKELKELNYSVNPKDYLVKLTNFAKNNDTSITKYDLKRRYKSCNDYERIDVLRCKKENDNEYICVPDKISKCISYNTYLDTIVENHGKWKSFKERDSAMNAWIKQNNELKDIYD